MKKYRRWKWEKSSKTRTHIHSTVSMKRHSVVLLIYLHYEWNTTQATHSANAHTFWLLPVVVQHLNVRAETKRGKNVIINHSKKNTRINGKIVLQTYPSCFSVLWISQCESPTSSCVLIERKRQQNKKKESVTAPRLPWFENDGKRAFAAVHSKNE